MAFEKINMDLTALNNVTAPNINISGSDSFTSIISASNTIVSDLMIFASMFIILIIVYYTLSDKTPLQDFGYDDLRALNIALATTTIMGMTIFSVGWSSNFFAIGMFTSLWLLSFITILIYENVE